MAMQQYLAVGSTVAAESRCYRKNRLYDRRRERWSAVQTPAVRKVNSYQKQHNNTTKNKNRENSQKAE